ncbi:hypothetical protein QJS10_CPA01g01605 [Acorus calamus]|uniref:Senescence-associated family protein n=1 Tax=Acorus calamus TaxID=4465 RepID=A0AAV9FKV8_ACOCL|nr:hypothetical protein QJS10_CPA01g01605 [Acorus calamus]
MAANGANFSHQCGTMCSFIDSAHRVRIITTSHRFEFKRLGIGHLLSAKSRRPVCGKYDSLVCLSTGTQNSEVKEIEDSRCQTGELEAAEVLDSGLHDHYHRSKNCPTYSSQGLAEACKFAYNDAKFVNERAPRAREDTEKIDHGVKKKAARLHHVATILKDKAQSKLKRAADQHWSDGALEADLRRADLLAKRRAMEDAYMALKFVRNIHDMMVTKMNKLPMNQGTLSVSEVMGLVTLEKNGKTMDFFPGEVSTDRISAIQEAYQSMASALSEADGIDYTDPDELELLVAALIDLDAMDGKSSVSLLAECSSSPDVSTRQALANALATAPSMWTLGNAGMGALQILLQRLAEDSNPAIAAAASKAIDELKRQWEIETGDSLRFMMNQEFQTEETDPDADMP